MNLDECIWMNLDEWNMHLDTCECESGHPAAWPPRHLAHHGHLAIGAP